MDWLHGSGWLLGGTAVASLFVAAGIQVFVRDWMPLNSVQLMDKSEFEKLDGRNGWARSR
jgi:hypothetical protein